MRPLTGPGSVSRSAAAGERLPSVVADATRVSEVGTKEVDGDLLDGLARDAKATDPAEELGTRWRLVGSLMPTRWAAALCEPVSR